jgi:hydrogenase nickel incorporation protein HypB
MCETCGCAVTAATVSSADQAVLRHLLEDNDHMAGHNREHFAEHGVLVVNLMSAPGSGKTSLLEATIDSLKGEFRIGVIEGDLETENDALRIRSHGVPAVQITTGSACHLDAHMVHEAVHELDLDDLDILFIENVGNLVCPAAFDLGKPVKYPVMFRAADLVLISKSDLAPYIDDFDRGRAEHALRRIACAAPVFTLSARRCTALDPWLDWLRAMSAEARVPA